MHTIASDVASGLNLLVIGAGSIGRRHARNLRNLGAHVHLYDINSELLINTCRTEGYTPCMDFDLSIEQYQFDAAFICTPTHLHIPFSQKIAGSGIDLFIEKPLSNTLEGVDNLIQVAKNNNCIGMVGFMLRFEPGLIFLKERINSDEIAFAQIECGSHMPMWRSGVDYRKVYSANRSMGGGIILDDVHELDYACWLFGYPKYVISEFGQFSSFDIDVEDTAMIIFAYGNKMVSIHSDYLQRKNSRRCKVCDRLGYTMEWIFGNSVHINDEHGEHVFFYADTFDDNQIYIDEVRCFIDCIKRRVQPESDLENGREILKLAITAKHEI